MQAAAQLKTIRRACPLSLRERARERVFSHNNRPHDLAILLAKQRHCPGLNCLLLSHVVHVDRIVRQDCLVDRRLDAAERLPVNRLVVSEVKAQPVGSHQRAGLGHVWPQMGAQLAVQQMGGRVVAADVGAAGAIDFQQSHVARFHFTLSDLANVDDETGDGPARVIDAHRSPAGRRQASSIADLAAGLDVERRGRGDDLDPLPGVGRVEWLPVADQGQNGRRQRRAGVRVVIDARFVQLAAVDERPQHVGIDVGADDIVSERAAAAGQRMGLAGRVIALLIHGHAVLLAGHVARDLQWQTVGGVEIESHVAGDLRLAAAVQVVNQFVQMEEGFVEGAVEALLFAAQRVQDKVAPLA